MRDNKALYLGTFDPFTNGHLDIIERSSKLFSKIIVGIGTKEGKNIFFTQEERLKMIQESCAHLQNIVVKSFSGLAVFFAEKEDASVLIRGLRTEADFNYEMQMALMNKNLSSRVETIFIPSRQALIHISSSLLKEVNGLRGDISACVPESVYKNFMAKKI